MFYSRYCSIFLLLILTSFSVYGQEIWTSNASPPNQLSTTHSLPKKARVDVSDFDDILDDLKNLFEEPYFFEDKSFVLQIGVGFRSDVDLENIALENDGLDIKTIIPALSIIGEKNIGSNIGVGFGLGAQLWNVPVFDYKYRYFTGSLRAAYHFNVIEKLDPYAGAAATFRYFDLTNSSENQPNTKITAMWIVGARYYLSDGLGVFIEAGNDTPTWFKGGISFYMN